ncbi:MAG: nitroreductase family protein [Actinomycetota bacterium]|nr:nitroreductase family protein [Actinomycetota bacterium]
MPDEKIEAILDIARRFPSAGDTQPQEFILVRDPDIKEALGEAALEQMFVAEAPVVIVTVSDTKRSAGRYGRRGVDFYSVIDGAFVSLLVLLASVDQELGAAFVGAFDDDAVREVLGLPEHVRPIGIIPIGYCAEEPMRVPRRSIDEIVHRERYG